MYVPCEYGFTKLVIIFEFYAFNFYFFTFLLILFSVPLQCLGGMGFPARITQQGYGKNAIASY